MSDQVFLNARIIGLAENAHRALLERILTDSALGYQDWVALSVTASAKPDDGDTIAARISDALKVDSAVAQERINSLMLHGLIERDPAAVRLSEAGRNQFTATRRAIDDVMSRVYGDISTNELAIAGRVLTLVTERVNHQLRS